MSGSVSVLSEAIHSATDLVASLIAFFSVRASDTPPDAEHPYGHGRYETLAGLAVGAMLLLSGAAIFWHGFISLGERREVQAYALYPLLGIIRSLFVGLMS